MASFWVVLALSTNIRNIGTNQCSWEPQLASAIPVSYCDWQVGKWRKLWKIWSWDLWKVLPKVDMPLRYLTTCLTALRCPSDGEFWYWERSDLTVEISGLMQWANHCKDPICNMRGYVESKVRMYPKLLPWIGCLLMLLLLSMLSVGILIQV